ncbi:MAG: MgtC/SapB family protein [Anaerolineae bacterium]
MFLRLLIAVILGAFVGYKRERAGKPAGVRTHGMVSLGAALFAVVSLHGFGNTGVIRVVSLHKSSLVSAFWRRGDFAPAR